MAQWKAFSVFLASPSAARAETVWRPLADVYRTKTGWLLKIDLAGVEPRDVSVQIHGCRVQITGVRRDITVETEEACVCHSMEIAYNRFERIIDLPCEIHSARFALEFQNGILLIRIVQQEG